MSRLTRDGTAEPVSRDQILRHARGQGNIHFPCSADHEQDWQPYPVDPYSAICDDHTYIHTYSVSSIEEKVLVQKKQTTPPHLPKKQNKKHFKHLNTDIFFKSGKVEVLCTSTVPVSPINPGNLASCRTKVTVLTACQC